MQAQAFLDSLTADPAEADNLVHVEDLPARDPKPLPFPDDLPEVLVSRLSLLGVEGLFEHQRRGARGPALRAQRDARDRDGEREVARVPDRVPPSRRS